MLSYWAAEIIKVDLTSWTALSIAVILTFRTTQTFAVEGPCRTTFASTIDLSLFTANSLGFLLLSFSPARKGVLIASFFFWEDTHQRSRATCSIGVHCVVRAAFSIADNIALATADLTHWAADTFVVGEAFFATNSKTFEETIWTPRPSSSWDSLRFD